MCVCVCVCVCECACMSMCVTCMRVCVCGCLYMCVCMCIYVRVGGWGAVERETADLYRDSFIPLNRLLDFLPSEWQLKIHCCDSNWNGKNGLCERCLQFIISNHNQDSQSVCSELINFLIIPAKVPLMC